METLHYFTLVKEDDLFPVNVLFDEASKDAIKRHQSQMIPEK